MELSNRKQIIVMNIFFVFFAVLFLIVAPNVSAQEGEVCIVYFTGDACGDDCKLTDSFMDGLINEYIENLLAIKYNIDLSQENKNIFEAYRRTYNLPHEVPLLLFGENDYISGMYNIFRNAEPKIYGLISTNGTNCPLDSGYVPPGNVDPEVLPGDPEVYESDEGESPGEGEGGSDSETGEEEKGEDFPVDLEDIERILREDQTFLVLLILVAVLIAGFLVFLLKRR